MELVYKNERKLFVIAVTIASIVWVAVVVASFGLALLFVPIVFLVYLFAQSGFISYIKGNGVRVTDTQFHDLHARLKFCCERIGMQDVPEMYLVRTDTFNALATKFLGRRFIVLFTDVADALADEPDALNFYIGHELGHLQRGHLKWMGYLTPAMILPVLGTSYRRAQEYTCDRYGARCCDQERHAALALGVMSAGDSRYRDMSWRGFVDQIRQTSEFWMSFHEFLSDYPWLCKRMASAVGFMRGEEVHHPRRSAWAGFLSVFVPRAGVGSGGMISLFATIMMIAIAAAIAVPAYQGFASRQQVEGALDDVAPIQVEIESFVDQTGAWPTSLVELGYDSEELLTSDGKTAFRIYENGVIGLFIGNDPAGQGRFVVLEPFVDGDGVAWRCFGENMLEWALPAECGE